MHFFEYLARNYSIVFLVINGIAVLIALAAAYDGKDKIQLVSSEDMNKIYTSDEKMFLRYAKMIKSLIPEEGSPKYKKLDNLFNSISQNTYRSVNILYGAKMYYAVVGFSVGAIVGLLPVIFNIVIKKAAFNIIPINFPIALTIALPFLGLILWFYPEMDVKSRAKSKRNKLQKEIMSLGIVIHSMLDTGNNPYQILEVVKEIKPEFKEDVEKTLNEYYIDTSRALKNLKARIAISDFDMIADSLLWAHEADNTFACLFLADYLNRLEQSQKVEYQKSSKIRPYFLLGASVLPMGGALIVWFYPWIQRAVEMLSSGFGV